MNEIHNTQALIRSVLSFLSQTPWEPYCKARLERLYDLSEMPCELAIAGKVKAGKSSFLNALLGVDLAMVGTTETTATINYFKYGYPEDPDKPVIVYWNDGRDPEAQTKEFLDSLQGYDKDVLERAIKIDHLEYLVPDKRLKHITLIDTPGFGSVEDVHEQRTAGYFNPQLTDLRELHTRQSDSLAEGADAVVYISTPVPESSAQKFFGEYIPNISAINAIGVMTQIDRENNAGSEVINRMVKTLASSYRRELSTVVPVSAGVYHAVKKLQRQGTLAELQSKIRQIPKDEFNDYFDGDSQVFYDQDGDFNSYYESVGLSYDDRVIMVSDMQWKVFYTIAVALYYREIDDAVDYLIDYSGMEKVNNILEKQFFSRSRAIRCSKIIKEVQKILVYLKNVALPELKSRCLYREVYLSVLNYAEGHFDKDMLTSFRCFVDNNILSSEKCDSFSAELDTLLVKADEVKEGLTGQGHSSEGLHLLDKLAPMLRNNDEVEELEILFGKYPDKIISTDRAYLMQRQRFWNVRQQRIKSNRELSRLLALAYAMYGKLLNE